MIEPERQPDPSEPLKTETATPDAPAARVSVLEKSLSEADEKVLRALAEVENMRRRSERDRQDTAKFAVASFARDLLTVADNLKRALNAIPPAERDGNEHLKSIFTGVEATERELLRVFEGNGIKKIDPLGQKFDPNFHEVLFEVPAADKEPGTVMQVVEPGYVIHERLLRPARVGVAAGGADRPGIDQQV